MLIQIMQKGLSKICNNTKVGFVIRCSSAFIIGGARQRLEH